MNNEIVWFTTGLFAGTATAIATMYFTGRRLFNVQRVIQSDEQEHQAYLDHARGVLEESTLEPQTEPTEDFVPPRDLHDE
jgi:hypothetical protein